MDLSPRRRSKSRKTQSSSTKTPLKQYYRAGPSTSVRSPFEKTSKLASRKRRFLLLIINLTITFLLLFGLVYSLILRPPPRIYLDDNSYHPISAYQQAAAKDLQIFKNRNKITLDDKELIASLQSQFPEIVAAVVDLPLLGQTPIIHIDIASPSLLLNSGQNSYIIDSQGKAIGQKKDFPQVADLPVVTDQSNFSPTEGQQLLGTNVVSFIKTVIAQSKREGVPIQSLSLPPIGQELDLRAGDRPYYVKFYLGGEPLAQVGQFLAARQEFDAKNSQPSEYLDVRVSGKVFYR